MPDYMQIIEFVFKIKILLCGNLKSLVQKLKAEEASQYCYLPDIVEEVNFLFFIFFILKDVFK